MSDEFWNKTRMGLINHRDFGDFDGCRVWHRLADWVVAMTDQKQAPERIVKILRNHAEDPMWADHCEMHKTVAAKAADMIEALAKQRDELAAQNKNQEAMIRQADRRGDRLKAERDQALAASAAREIAMRDRAAEECMHHLTDEADEALADIWIERIEALPLSPDGQQALNKMLADAWGEGRSASYRAENPYRKDAT